MKDDLAQTPEQQSKSGLFVRAWAWTVGTWPGRVVGLGLLLALIISLYWWPDSGFDAYQGGNNFQRARTLWDWLGLLGVPLVLAVGGFAFSRAERKNEQEIAIRRSKEERERADKRADLERELADKRAIEERQRADDALRQQLVQDYLDRMSELLFNKNLTTSKPKDLVREVARARTLTMLRGLGEDGARKGYIVEFLYETGLINAKGAIVGLGDADLRKAKLFFAVLREADLSGANLSGSDLTGTNLIKANLSGAIFHGANLCGVSLFEADLIGARLKGAELIEADLIGANLSTAFLNQVDLTRADLYRANLSGAILRRTNFNEANLLGVDLSNADLRGAVVEHEQLSQALSLEGATLPNGLKYAGVPPTVNEVASPSPDDASPSSQSDPTI